MSPVKLFSTMLLIVSSVFSSRILKNNENSSNVYEGICSSYIDIIKGYKCARDFHISRGTASSVFLISNDEGKLFAMKVQSKSKGSQHEVEMYKKLRNSDFVAKLMAEGFYEDIHIIVLEYAERKSLEVVLQTSDYFSNIFRMVDLFKKILVGIQYIHKAGYVHCQINLQNILITETYEPLIVDFDLATKIGQQDDFKGFPAYSSPELILAMNMKETLTYTESIDIYAAGVILYYMHLHSFPFDHRQLNYNRMVNTPIVFLEGSSTIFMNIVRRTLQMSNNVSRINEMIEYIRNQREENEYPLPNSYFYTMIEYKLHVYTKKMEMISKSSLILMVASIIVFVSALMFCFCQICLFFVWSKTSKNTMSARPSEMNIDTTFIDSVNVSRVGGLQTSTKKVPADSNNI